MFKAGHLTLVHYFEQEGTGNAFWTDDWAVCAPAGKDLNGCRVNDVLTIVGGTGKFANAEGSLRNHGLIDLARGMRDANFRGRVCGEGASGRALSSKTVELPGRSGMTFRFCFPQ